MHSRRGIARSLVAGAAIAAFAPAAVAMANSGPSHGAPPGQHQQHHKQRYYRVTGWVVPSANATTLTVRGLQGRSQSFVVNSATKYTNANGSSATAANATPYHVVSVTGTVPATRGGNPVATRVVIGQSAVEGIVKSDTNGTLTVVDSQGFARQVSTGSATCTQRRTKVSCSSIASGNIVAARGTVAPDGTTLDASRVEVTPASA